MGLGAIFFYACWLRFRRARFCVLGSGLVIGNTAAGSSPVLGGSLVTRLRRSIAILCDPIPRIMRWAFGSRAITLCFSFSIGTILGGFGMHTAWPMPAGKSQSESDCEISQSLFGRRAGDLAVLWRSDRTGVL